MHDYDSCVNYLTNSISYIPNTVLILGSGFSNYANSIMIDYEIPYSKIPGFPIPMNVAHPGKLLVGRSNGHKILIMQGRVHYYEGYDVSDIVFPIRVFKLMGVNNIILTNASGGINKEYEPGTVVLVKDHIASLIPNSLRGKNEDRFGERFPDSSNIYSKKIRNDIKNRCTSLGINLKEGVYIQTPGPSFETPAEIRAYGLLGADLVGMSTACEAIAASHAGMNICCLSCVTNYASGITKNRLTVSEIDDTISKVYSQIEIVLTEVIEYFAKEDE